MPEFLNINEILAYGYIGIFIVIFLESGIFFPLPGDSLLFAAGLFASDGKMNAFFLFVLVVIASFLGILAGYHIGSHLEKWRHRAFCPARRDPRRTSAPRAAAEKPSG